MRRLLLLVAFSVFTLRATAAQLEATLSPQDAKVGDELSLELRVSGVPPSAIRFPTPDQSSFTLLKIDTSRLAKESTLRYALAVYDTGRFVLTEMPVVVMNGAQAETLYTPQLGVTIRTMLPDSASIPMPIKPYREHPFRWRDLLRDIMGSPWAKIIGVVLLVLVGFLIWRKYFRKKTAEELAISIPLLPPHEQAVRDLIALKDKRYASRGMLKEFFSEYSQIMRTYMERRYEFPALEMTTFELERELESNSFPQILTRNLIPTFHEADLVKFARYIPPLERCEDMLETGFEIVDKTKPVELPETESKAA